MKTLNNLEITGALYQADTGPEAQVGDQIKMFLDTDSDPGFPPFIFGIIQHPIVRVACDTKTSYSVEYNEADLLGAANALIPANVIDATIVTAADLLNIALAAEIVRATAAEAAEIVRATAAEAAAISNATAANAALIQSTSFSNATGNTTITIPAGCELYTVYGTFSGSAGTRIIVLDTTNAVVGTEIRFVAALPATAAIVLDIRNATAGGTQVTSLTTDTSGDDAMFTLGFTTVWNKISTAYPN